MQRQPARVNQCLDALLIWHNLRKENPVSYRLTQLYPLIPGSSTSWNFRFTSELQKKTTFFFFCFVFLGFFVLLGFFYYVAILRVANIKFVLPWTPIINKPEMHVMAPRIKYFLNLHNFSKFWFSTRYALTSFFSYRFLMFYFMHKIHWKPQTTSSAS